MITRRKDYCKREPSKDANKLYIICEGKGTEPDYFRFFQGLASNLEIIIIPPEDGTDPLKLMELAESIFLSETGKHTLDHIQHDEVWFVIDTDTWEQEGKITPLRDFCHTMNRSIPSDYNEAKPYEAWNVAQSNPCFEIWLYYHHYDNIPDAEETEKHPSVKSYVNDMIAGGFDHQRDPVRLPDAIINSEKNFNRRPNGNPDRFSTELYILGKGIMGFVGTEIKKLRNKMG